MHYQLIRSQRKTLSLQINHQAELIIRAPKRLNIKAIEAFIAKKSHWIDKNLQIAQQNSPQKIHYKNNEKFLYLGRAYPLMLGAEFSTHLDFDGVCFKTNQANQVQFLAWYKTLFKKIALPRLDYYADNFQLPYQHVRFKKQKTVWGSCSSSNNINLNYLLIQAPMAVIDYVIVHELAHTVHKNHSKHFWQLVQSILPNYKTSNRWLKDNSHQLHQIR